MFKAGRNTPLGLLTGTVGDTSFGTCRAGSRARERSAMTIGGTEAESSFPWELFERGDLHFVDAIRQVSDAGALADFAGRWFEDPRPSSRQMLLDYFALPLNAFRHEGLIKRLFKKAEA